jgi:hypothetical protein
VQRIRALLSTQEAKRLLEKDNLAELKEALVNELGDDEYYAILAARSIRIQNRVSPILKALTFLGEPSARELQTAIDHFKSKDGVIDKAAPVDFLSPDERKAITEGAKFRVSLYKALLFVHVQGAIKSGTLNLKHSYKYRPLDEYLIDRDRWHRDKAALIERAQLQTFVDPHQVLAELDEALSCQYEITNANIHEGKNPYIKFKNTGFTISTPTQEESDAEPLQQFFPERHYLPLLEILATVNRYSHWMDELQHWQQRHHCGRPSGANGLRGRYRNRVHHRYSQNGKNLSPDQRVGIGAYRQLVLFARQHHCRQRSPASIHGPLGIAEPDAPFRRSIAHFQRRPEIRGARRFAQCQLLVQILRQGPRRECLYFSRRARSVMVLAGL